jgi:hypothetical protein
MKNSSGNAKTPATLWAKANFADAAEAGSEPYSVRDNQSSVIGDLFAVAT